MRRRLRTDVTCEYAALVAPFPLGWVQAPSTAAALTEEGLPFPQHGPATRHGGTMIKTHSLRDDLPFAAIVSVALMAATGCESRPTEAESTTLAATPTPAATSTPPMTTAVA